MPCCNELECIFTFDNPFHIYLCLPPPPGWTTPSVTPVLPAKSTGTFTSTRTRTYTSKPTIYPRDGENWGCDNSHCVPPHAHPERDATETTIPTPTLSARGGEDWVTVEDWVTTTIFATATFVTTPTLAARGGENLGCDNSHCVPPHAHPERDIESSASLIERDCGCTGHDQLDKRGGENWGCDNSHCVPPHAHPERDIESSVSLSDRDCGCTGSSKRSDANWGCDNSHCVPPHAHPERDIKADFHGGDDSAA